ncbi:hypothetical protein QR680_004277 [Steinernema hermaphroditum]|uniref:F-box domain-containing protein n=1 Tax=Steinernema hermaphroditum TaxID=289476 RepID=A0AA39HPL3_9BILA|nr:hypothetical protein QR680_004277 [Steinernema hermaphroditum]
MDQLSGEIVDRILDHVNCKSMVRTAAGPSEHWAIRAADHLKRRFYLNVDIYIYGKASSKKKVEDEKIQVCVKRKFFHEESFALWDFKNATWDRRYAQIQGISIQSFDRQDQLPIERAAAALEEVLQFVSLPVDSIGRSRSSLEIHNISPSAVDTALKILQAVHKTFNQLRNINPQANHSSINDYLKNYVCEGTLLQSLYIEAPCDVQMIKVFIDKWLQSNIYLHLVLSRRPPEDLLNAYGISDNFIQHPSRRCSLFFDLIEDGKYFVEELGYYNYKKVVSLITDWKNGSRLLLGAVQAKNAFHDFSKERMILMETEDIWDRLMDTCRLINAVHDGLNSIVIQHHFDTGSLVLRKHLNNKRVLTLDVSYKNFTVAAFEAIIDDWKKSDGNYVTIGHSTIEMNIKFCYREGIPNSLLWVDEKEFNFITHPTENARLKLQRLFAKTWEVTLRLSIVRVDPEVMAR